MAGAINAGVKMFQIRSKQKDQRLLEDVQRCAQLASQNNCFLVINDYMDIAKQFGMPVHLGQEDLQSVTLSMEDIYGLSTRSSTEILSAIGQQNRPLYVGFEVVLQQTRRARSYYNRNKAFWKHQKV